MRSTSLCIQTGVLGGRAGQAGAASMVGAAESAPWVAGRAQSE